MSAATCPTLCLSAPRTSIRVTLGVSTTTSTGILYSIGWENPNANFNTPSSTCARYPTPTNVNSFSNPCVTPTTILAINERTVPVLAIEPVVCSLGLQITCWPSLLIRTDGCTTSFKLPFGPVTETQSSSISTATSIGIIIGMFAIRDITKHQPLGHNTYHFTSKAPLTRLSICHQPL